MARKKEIERTVNALVFLHLSDIHFTSRSNSHYDPDFEIRKSLVREAIDVRNQIGYCTGILVCGDIAFSGSKQEYRTARDWLGELCRELKCPAESVWTIPGNHDVERSVVKNSTLIQDRHAVLRDRKSDEEVGRLVRDPEAFETILRPLANYLDFSSQYDCRPEKGKLHWTDDVTLSDRSTLRIRGCNSAIVSDELDNDNQNRLIVGADQVTGDGDVEITNLVMCHHPLDWIHDADNVKSWLKARARVVLFGHKHVQCIEKTENSLFIMSGAVHPDRSEGGWRPRFNFIVIDTVSDGEKRQLQVDTWTRYWDNQEKRFRPEFNSNGSAVRSDRLDLPPLVMPVLSTTTRENNVGTNDSKSDAIVNPKRALVYRFFGLPYVQRIQVATELELIENDDAGLKEEERYRFYFKRAEERNILQKLWLAVEQKHGVDITGKNPFETEENNA